MTPITYRKTLKRKTDFKAKNDTKIDFIAPLY